MKRQFIDGRVGQVHVRVARPDSPVHRPLVCLHMSPKSGRIYARFMEQAASTRIVIAPDYPGFGESDSPPAEPPVTIEDYAASVWEVVDALELGTVDLLGYHTGSLVAAEAARQRPEHVGNIVMIGAPVFTTEELDEAHRMYETIPLDTDGTRFQHMWKAVLAHRGAGMTLEMAADSFAENLRAGEDYEWGHRAAFQYAPKFAEVVSTLPHHITVINPQDDLSEQTPRIAPYLQNGIVENHFEWGHGFLDAHTEAAITVIKNALLPHHTE